MNVLVGFIRTARRAILLAAVVSALCLSVSGTASAAFISVAKNLVIAPGGSLTVPVELTNDSASPLDILNIDIYIAFDNTLLAVSNLQPGAFTSGGSWTRLLVASNATGQIDTTQSIAIAAQLAGNTTTTVLAFDVLALAAFTPGSTTPINILARVNGLTTNINEGQIPLDPAPTNASDDAVDGLITVRGGDPVIPEPSSIILVSLGGLGLAVGTLRRKARA